MTNTYSAFVLDEALYWGFIYFSPTESSQPPRELGIVIRGQLESGRGGIQRSCLTKTLRPRAAKVSYVNQGKRSSTLL